jgi:N-acetylneuraminic acid mutarotase
MCRIPMRLAGRVSVLAWLAALAAACSPDSLPTQPDVPSGAAPVDVPTANYVTDTWGSRPAMTTARRGLLTAAVNGTIYAIGGRGASEMNLGTVEAFHPRQTLLPWTTKASLPSPRAWPSGAAVINGKIYVPGGLNADANPTRSLLVYDPASDTWVAKAQVPVATYGGAAVTVGGKLYVFTPRASNTLVHRYDPATDAWTVHAAGPNGHYYPSVGVIDGKIYVAGTMAADEKPSRVVSMYDPAANSWSEKADMLDDQIGAGGVAIAGKLYMVNGFWKLNIGPRAVLWVYNPATDAWVSKTYPPAQRGFLSAVAVNGVLYAIGGLNPPHALKTNQVYFP